MVTMAGQNTLGSDGGKETGFTLDNCIFLGGGKVDAESSLSRIFTPEALRDTGMLST